MDAFYSSVEQRDRPELKGKPVKWLNHGQIYLIKKKLSRQRSKNCNRRIYRLPDRLMACPLPSRYAVCKIVKIPEIILNKNPGGNEAAVSGRAIYQYSSIQVRFYFHKAAA